MSDENRPQGPGLKWRGRNKDVPYWFASATTEGRAALKKDYPVKSANLAKLTDQEITERCERLQTEARLWVNNVPRRRPVYLGTFGSLITAYETDAQSTLHENKPGVQRSYMVYIRRLKIQLGEVQVDDSDGTDLKRWFKEWRYDEDGTEHLARANGYLAVLKAALRFGCMRRFKGVGDFKAAIEDIEFPKPKPRTFAPTSAQIKKARKAAIDAGAPERALVYSLQFEPTIRQFDIIGEWLPLSDAKPSLIHNGRQKWVGPMWSAIDAKGILRLKPSKTEDTTNVDGVYDLTVCPMVQEDLARIPVESRKGPLIVDHETGLPYDYQDFHKAWRADFEAAGLPKKLWCRDLRAGGVTEGGKAGASKDDRRKLATHADDDTTEIYDRDMIEAGRRVMAARTNYRKNET